MLKGMLSRLRYSPIGVELKDSAAYAVQLARSGEHHFVHAVNRRPRPASGEGDRAVVVDLLRELVLAPQFRGRQVVSSLPREQTDIRPVRLSPDADPDDRRAFLRTLAERAEEILPYDPKKAILDYLPLGISELNGKRHLEALLIAARKVDVDAYLGLFQDAGLQCINLDVAPCAAARVVGAGDDWTCTVVEIDKRTTIITVVHGSRVLFTRAIGVGRATLESEAAQALELEPEQAAVLLARYGVSQAGALPGPGQAGGESGILDAGSLAHVLYEVCGTGLRRVVREIRNSIDYFVSTNWKHTVARVVVSGERPFSGLVPFLEAELGTPVELDEWAKRGFIGPSSPAADSAYAVAAGLALRGERA
jgi:type IV pilus assembly protein PilM